MKILMLIMIIIDSLIAGSSIYVSQKQRDTLTPSAQSLMTAFIVLLLMNIATLIASAMCR